MAVCRPGYAELAFFICHWTEYIVIYYTHTLLRLRTRKTDSKNQQKRNDQKSDGRDVDKTSDERYIGTRYR